MPASSVPADMVSMAGADFKSVRRATICPLPRSRFGRVRVGKDAIEGKIKLVGTPCARWQTEAHLLRLTGHRIAIGSLIPFERSLSPFVDEAYGQNAEKVHHRSEAESPDLAEGHGPGKQKRDLEIENDEKQRHQIEAHVESHARVIEGIKSAFIGGKFFSGSGALNATRKGATSKAPEITAATAMKTASGRYWSRRLGMNELGLK